MSKFIRCFCYGLEPGETVVAQVEGQAVTFTYSTPQVDVPVAPTVEANIPAPVEEAPAPTPTVEDSTPAPAPVSDPTE